jgi:hypothetical protein
MRFDVEVTPRIIIGSCGVGEADEKKARLAIQITSLDLVVFERSMRNIKVRHLEQ